MSLATILAAATHDAVLAALVTCHGHRGNAAAALEVAPRTFARMMAEHFAPGELDALARAQAWPTRTELAAHALACRLGR